MHTTSVSRLNSDSCMHVLMSTSSGRQLSDSYSLNKITSSTAGFFLAGFSLERWCKTIIKNHIDDIIMMMI